MPYDNTLIYIVIAVVFLIITMILVWINIVLSDKNKEIADLRMFATQLQHDL